MKIRYKRLILQHDDETISPSIHHTRSIISEFPSTSVVRQTVGHTLSILLASLLEESANILLLLGLCEKKRSVEKLDQYWSTLHIRRELRLE